MATLLTFTALYIVVTLVLVALYALVVLDPHRTLGSRGTLCPHGTLGLVALGLRDTLGPIVALPMCHSWTSLLSTFLPFM